MAAKPTKKTTKKKQASLLSKALDLIIGKPAKNDGDRGGNVNQNKQLKKLDRD